MRVVVYIYVVCCVCGVRVCVTCVCMWVVLVICVCDVVCSSAVMCVM